MESMSIEYSCVAVEQIVTFNIRIIDTIMKQFRGVKYDYSHSTYTISDTVMMIYHFIMYTSPYIAIINHVSADIGAFGL